MYNVLNSIFLSENTNVSDAPCYVGHSSFHVAQFLSDSRIMMLTKPKEAINIFFFLSTVYLAFFFYAILVYYEIILSIQLRDLHK